MVNEIVLDVAVDLELVVDVEVAAVDIEEVVDVIVAVKLAGNLCLVCIKFRKQKHKTVDIEINTLNSQKPSSCIF